LAEIVGTKIKRLKPEDRLEQIVGWAESPIQVSDLIKVLQTAYGIRCTVDATFRALVEKVTASRAQKAPQP
jgi:predicted nucleotidyltransferase